jgi:hypothetical protein
MAQAKDNIVTKGFSGTIDRTLTFRQRAGVTIVSKLRRPGTTAITEKMQAVRTKFLSSIAYAKKAIRDTAKNALYKLAVTGLQSSFNVATADAFNAPVVNSINKDNYHGVVGDSITIDATDDFKVESVLVSIHSAAGALIEQGNAVTQVDKPDWLYTVTQANAALSGSKITATATDMPGNTASLEITIP